MEPPLIAAPAPALADWIDLQKWVTGRQAEAAWKNWALFVDLTWSADPLRQSATSLENWDLIKRKLDAREPVLVGLMPVSRLTWEAHSVVAWSYAEQITEAGETIMYLWIYDPNHPDQDSLWLEASKARVFTWAEYSYNENPLHSWSAIAALEYEDPGRQSGWRVPSVFTADQIRSYQPGFLSIGAKLHYITEGISFPMTENGRSALGGYWETTIIVPDDPRSDLEFECHKPGPHCYPSSEMVMNEIQTGLSGSVRPDGSYCPVFARGTVIPDGQLAGRFTERSGCPYVPPPVPTADGGHTGGIHTLRVALENIDDDAYVWIENVGTPETSICAARRDQGGYKSCDISSRLSGKTYLVLWFKIGNYGCLNSYGTVAVDIDGVRRWVGYEFDTGVKHCGWTYRARVPVDLEMWKIDERAVTVDSCYNVRDCED